MKSSSLVSMVVGESQILGQVKQAWELSKKYGFLNYTMEFVFQKAFQIAKKIIVFLIVRKKKKF